MKFLLMGVVVLILLGLSLTFVIAVIQELIVYVLRKIERHQHYFSGS